MVKETKAKKTTKPVRPMKQTYKDISQELCANARTSILAGRPTKYRQEYAQMLYEHFDIEITQIKNILDRQGKKVRAEVATNFPTLSGFARKIGVYASTIRDWANNVNDDGSKQHPEFYAAYRFAKEVQDEFLVVNTLNGAYKENFAKFLATNILDYQERQTQNVNLSATGISHIDSDMEPNDASRAYAAAMSDEQ